MFRINPCSRFYASAALGRIFRRNVFHFLLSVGIYYTMDKKAWFFRNIVANLAIVAVLAVTAAYLYLDDSAPVSLNEPIYKGSSATRVSLMVNVSLGTEHVADMLRIFKENDVRTTFFVGGSWAAEHNETLREIFDGGFEIGNHGYFQKDHKKLSPQRSREEIELTHKLVRSVTGCEMSLFAPPSGSFSKSVMEGAKELGYTTILWSKDTLGGDTGSAPIITERAMRDLTGGDLILMQPTRETVAALPDIIRIIRAAGLSIAPVSEVIKVTAD